MVKLNTIHDIDRDLVQSQPIVAVFIGGTGGIGALTLKAFAKTVAENKGKGLRAYIVGRNASAAESLLAECRSIYPDGQYSFIKADDLSLVDDVDKACKKAILAEEQNATVAKQVARIDYLMVSHGGPIFLPREDTKEGLDGTMSRFYYSRIACITTLMPLLLKSSLPATVISVYAAGMEAKLYADDLSLRDLSHYSYSQARSHLVYMTTVYFEELAKRYRDQLRLTHIFPGLVVHEGMYKSKMPWWLKFLFTKVIPFFGADMNLEESGLRMLSLASPSYYPAQSDKTVEKVAIIGSDGKLGSGAYALTWSGESNFPQKRYASLDKVELTRKVWDHTNKALEEIRAGRVFKE